LHEVYAECGIGIYVRDDGSDESWEIASGSLSGYVRETESNNPISLANIALNDTLYTTTTNELGYYEIFAVIPGDYTISATHDDYITVSKEITVVAGADTLVNLSMSLPVADTDEVGNGFIRSA
jgi:hypothetical protein